MRGLATDEVEGLALSNLSFGIHDTVDCLCNVLIGFWELLFNDLVSLALPGCFNFNILWFCLLDGFMTRSDQILKVNKSLTGPTDHVH